MDFSFTEEQTLLQESVSRFMQNDYGFEARQKTQVPNKASAPKIGKPLQNLAG
ncbi:MAG: hypothetical protein CM15mP120_12070 [Pseudomonadota bacterium]|nr:MAG: hypothetical protein CM15mP120_12070 [Pseudomonadota bacterium]